MATTPDQRPRGALQNCPFCGNEFRGLGNHLPHCKDRQGRDYSMYLAQKTLEKKSKKVSRKACPKCHKMFVRLDTHLKNSAICKSVASSDPSPLPEPSPPPVPCKLDNTPMPTKPAHHQKPDLRPSLKLPSSKEDWAEANLHFCEHLVPAVMNEASADAKNSVLCDGIYQYFSEKYGVRRSNPDKAERKRKNHDRALKRVKQLKKTARKEFQRAKREGLPPESIRALAQNFFTLVREHNHLKRASHNASLRKQTRKAKKCCHQHFWRYAKELLDDGAANQTTPQFGEQVAADYFKDVYHSAPKTFNCPDWMPSPQPPTEEFYCEEIATEEACTVCHQTCQNCIHSIPI